VSKWNEQPRKVYEWLIIMDNTATLMANDAY